MQRLFLVDFDGVCVRSGLLTYDSLLLKINDVLRLINKDPLDEKEWERISLDTDGSTELNLIKAVCQSRGILGTRKFNRFKTTFFILREEHLNIIDRKEADRFGRELNDQTYPDARHFFSQQKELDTIMWLVTGNPRRSMRKRLDLNPDWKGLFIQNNEMGGAFGDEAFTRQELIKIAIKRAEIKGFRIEKDTHSQALNIFYFGDTVKDLAAGIKTRVRTVFVPHGKEKPYDVNPNDYLKQLLLDQIFDPNDVAFALNTGEVGRPGVFYCSNFFNQQIASFVRPKLWRDKEAARVAEEQFQLSIESNMPRSSKR